MRPAVDADDYRGAPNGAFLAGRTWLHHCVREGLCGFALWGRPDEDDLRALERALLVELAPRFPVHDSVVDASRLEGVDPAAFGVLHAYVEQHRGRLAQQVRKLAIVRPAGVAGATVAGFFHVATAPYPVEIVADFAAALRTLGQREDGVAAAIEAAVADTAGAPALLVSLRRTLDAKPGRVALEDAARAVGLSARSLQRRLKELGSTFHREVAASQVRAAQRLLRESSATLTAIAFEVGCATPQHFSSLFRRVVGETPSAWRARTAGGR